MKEIARAYFPRSFEFLKKIKNQLKIEIRTIRNVGFWRLMSVYYRKERWEAALPVQAARKIEYKGLKVRDDSDLELLFSRYQSGGHSFYLSPEAWADSVLRDIQKEYPPGCGIKISRRTGGLSHPVVTHKNSGLIQEKILKDHRSHVLVSNYLYSNGLSPRVYDVIEIDAGDAKCVAYVVKHVETVNGSFEACFNIVSKFKRLTKENQLSLINWNGFDDDDFSCPDCNGNLRVSASGQACYVDTQNFKVLNYRDHLERVARSAQQVSHFGDRSLLLSGKYLYQKIPGLNLPAKRSPGVRIRTIDEMIKACELEYQGHIFIDVGSNLGLMSAEYLRRGAHWVHGLDFPDVVQKAESVCLAIGATRFSFFGLTLNTDVDLLEGAPRFVKDGLKPLVISYLAIRGHIGWVRSLVEIDWEYMIYEGHENEDRDMNLAYLEELDDLVPIEIRREGYVKDGNSLPRYLAIVAKK